MSAMTRGDCMISRLRRHGVELPADVWIERTRAGARQRAAGVWSWFAWSATEGVAVGSEWPVWALLKCRQPWRVHTEGHGTATVTPAAGDRAWLTQLIDARRVSDNAKRKAARSG